MTVTDEQIAEIRERAHKPLVFGFASVARQQRDDIVALLAKVFEQDEALRMTNKKLAAVEECCVTLQEDGAVLSENPALQEYEKIITATIVGTIHVVLALTERGVYEPGQP